MMKLKEYLEHSAGAVDKALNTFLPKEKEEPTTIHKAMRYSVFSGGKRVRPILAVEAARTCCGKPKDAMVAACAIELIHTYSLIHDDLPSMDDDDYRRGKPTCHRVFGEANAILAGDALLTLAFNIIAARMDPKRGAAVARELSEAAGTRGMVGGQAIDLEWQGDDVDTKTLNNIHMLKTAKLFEVSTKLGAVSAGAGRKAAAAMAAFGASVGMAFQMVDDIIDGDGYAKLYGEEKARRDCESLVLEAKAALAVFGRKAQRLKDIADYIEERRK